MPALTPIPPDTFKAILEKYGFKVEEESKDNWTLLNKYAVRPIITLPKAGELVSVDVMMEILDQLKIDNGTYFELLSKISN